MLFFFSLQAYKNSLSHEYIFDNFVCMLLIPHFVIFQNLTGTELKPLNHVIGIN